MTEHMEVANTIRDQITHFAPFALMAWGATNPTAMIGDDTKKGGLQLKVRGMVHKGYVEIKLAWNDTYTVETFKVRKGEKKITKTIDHVYFDQLVDVCDHLIEGQSFAR
tara:strand:- start:6831 stop:7157 length:327 start_codon:yes stop_codon:yes gene_type:complete